MTFQELLKDERKEEARHNAHNLFKNGVSYEVVRASIVCLSDVELQEIYKEVCGEQCKSEKWF